MDFETAIAWVRETALGAWTFYDASPLRDFADAVPLFALVLAIGLTWLAVDFVFGALGALNGGVVALRRADRLARARREAARLREQSGPRFAVLLGPIERDRAGVATEIVERALTVHAPAFLFDRPVELVRPPVRLSGEQSEEDAREWSRLSDADLVLWGRGPGRKTLMRLFFLTARARNEGGPAQEVRLEPPLSATERDRLAAGVAYLFARTALPCADEADRFRPEKLRPVLEALDRLAADPPSGIGPEFERLLREDAAKIALSIGRRLGDGEILRRASRLRVRLLAEIDKAGAPIDWAQTRAALGRAQLALGEVERDPRRLSAAVEAFAEAAEMLSGEAHRDERAHVLLDLGAAHAARGVLDGGHDQLDLAAKAYRAALKVAPEADPRFLDRARRGLARALRGLAEATGDSAVLEQSIELFRAAATDRARAIDPTGWARAQHELGLACATIGARDGTAMRYREAVGAFVSALEERTRESAPAEWSETMNQLGHAFYGLGRLEGGAGALEDAVTAYEKSLLERSREAASFLWAQTKNNLGNAHQALGERTGERWRVEAAVKAYREALSVFSKADHPNDWAGCLNNLGNALHVLGERSQGVQALEEALEAHTRALEVRTKDRSRIEWAATRNNIGLVLTTLGARLRDPHHLESAVAAYRDALGVFRLAGEVRYAVLAERNLERAQSLLSESRSAAE